ncbi:MAG: hypothetical protein CM15mP106_4320 [Candidatus Neomarinimicrobiota bacterium]|nr:MAG: hypothetical protein CM15mP106_4320 [Candidatus Neomarinimicrobiota bacterium]
MKNTLKTGSPLFSSHMLDLSAEEIDFNLSECERLLKRMSPIGMSLEIELGVTGGRKMELDQMMILELIILCYILNQRIV